MDLVDVEPVVQVAAELAGGRRRLEIDVGRGDEADVDARLSFSPMRRTSPASSARSSFAWSAFDSVPISSRKSVPPVGVLDEPGARAGGAGERALDVAEELGLEQRLGQRRAVEGDERPRGARAPRVDRARGELLAGAGLARDEDRSRRRRGALDQILDRSIAALSPMSASSRAVGPDLPLQEIDLARQLTALGRGADPHQQLVAEERLLHEVNGAELHRLDRACRPCRSRS